LLKAKDRNVKSAAGETT